MQLSITLSLFLACGSVMAATDTIDNELNVLSNIPTIAWGMQHQDHDGSVHWVAWEEGKGPCTNHAELSIKQKSVCGQKFSIGNHELKFADCKEDDPRSLHLANGSKSLCFKNPAMGFFANLLFRRIEILRCLASC
ncbi:hypothetical protein FE257_007794 [Aspergillus nanangensis]|uniref:Uncharacterized protein n=1 Tax=Aspergillus nanangensis TaxID=2582783 RepID=A0AAD4CXI4_ASPNN|nr:hypothetical protein FE257_007794 [Aspergillus nanangensis]